MTLILKIALIVGSLAFLVATRELASIAPLAMFAGALLIWWLDQEEPPRLFVWIAIAAGIAAAAMKGAPVIVAAGASVGLYLALEWWTRRSRRDDPTAATLLLGIVAAGGLGWLQFQSGSAGGSLPTTSPKRIVAIGDSLTSGLPGEGFQRWPDHLASALGAEAVNLSYPGDTASETFQRWGDRIGPRRWNPTNPIWEPDLIVVVIGGNDIRARVPRSQLKNDLLRWAETLKSHNVPVLFVSVPGGLLTDTYAGLWREVAEETGAGWMNDSILRTIFTTPSLTTDGIHFNAEGHVRFAEAVAERIRGG